MAISIEQARMLLGAEAESKTDEQVQQLVDNLSKAAGAFYDDIQTAWKRDPEAVRWMVHAQQTGEHEDESGVDEFETDPKWDGIE